MGILNSKKSYILKGKIFLLIQFALSGHLTDSEPNRILWNNQKLFLNGANVAYINFARDIGPGKTYFDQFETMFQQVHEAGGNCMRLWLHTNGVNTPAFGETGHVVGPGEDAIEDIRKILDLACENELGLIVCLWSFDMLRWELDDEIRQRNKCLLTETEYTQAYIDHALEPMVKALKGHPGLLAWEIFNEPEGMTDEFGWKHCDRVKMQDIQRIVNQCAGSIRRLDPKVLITNGAWNVRSTVDVDGCTNYYSDKALIAAGHDPDGILDFYSLHYYDWAGKDHSLFRKPASFWQLDKPLVCAEFEMTESFGVAAFDKHIRLYENGYAGALGYAWGPVDHFSAPAILGQGMMRVFNTDKEAVKLNMKTGFLTRFAADPQTIEAGQCSKLIWRATPGSKVSLNGQLFSEMGSLSVKPTTTTVYTITTADLQDSRQTEVKVLPSGMIKMFTADVLRIEPGDTVNLSWNTTSGSQVTLNSQAVSKDGTLQVHPDKSAEYILSAKGKQNENRTIRIEVAEPATINRALNKPVTVSSSDIRPGTDKPAFLNDADAATRWASKYAPDQWVVIDLGKTFDIKRVILNWELASGRKYKVQLSDNASVWTDIYETTEGDGGIDTLNGLQGSGRFIRLLLTERNTKYGYSLWEIEVYGEPSTHGSESQ